MTSSSPSAKRKINGARFYFEWHGHPISDLNTLHDITLAERPENPIIYLAGDSSLDNKYWVDKSASCLPQPIPDIYHKTLQDPAKLKPDVACWVNHLLKDRATCINAAVEATMLRDRDNRLLDHDKFIRDNIRPNDVLIVSVGANDVALRPSFSTMRHMLHLAWLSSRKSLEDGTALPLMYFRDFFGTKVQEYILRLTAKTRPRTVIVCMIYFPLEWGLGQESWADAQLKALGYNSSPEHLQTGIRAIYELATKQIRVEDTEIVPCALYKVLDGKTADDYTARVEPSEQGGQKMAQKFVNMLEEIWDYDDPVGS
ncbi:hypothetical protein TUN199_11424 [Pyrenophora tritici-repentis]|nr:hypothetical protein Alg130_11500 [Pyrenophora tritici-repentis]KAI0604318.1 hypothetical protein TUN205_11435 [Pyrenophora tritici-repentis]KAI0616584.1 hypothetical protein TUN199_11424 [Pyrenophora tritici-repentis]